MIKHYKHTTVLLNETIDNLNIDPNGIYIDGTFGYGGHSRLILEKLGVNGRLIAIDRDPQAINIANIIKDHRFSVIHGPFSLLANYVNERNLLGSVNGIILDLGVSSLQLDDATRGFSFMQDGPLDMRMDPTCGQSAATWLQAASENHIAWVLKNFGEERFSKQIARAIVKFNCIKPITRTKELVNIIKYAIPTKYIHKHPATRTFQAIRIRINNELKEIDLVLKGSINVLAPKSRLLIISFHSLEARIIKRFLLTYSHHHSIPTDLPITEAQFNTLNQYQMRLLNKLTPKREEILNNPRSRSAVLRVIEKVSRNQ